MIMGDICTRRCPFCDVGHGRPLPLDADEPANLAATIAALKLAYVVITSVDRDDLRDGGAQHFVDCIRAVRERSPATRIEVLVPDFRGRLDRALDVLAQAPPDVMNHNLETVPRLYKQARPGSDYANSLRLLQAFKARFPDIPTKSGLMVGLGETDEEILAVMRDMRAHGIDMLTIGPVSAADRFASAGVALRASGRRSRCSSAKRMRWASNTPPSARWCARRITPTPRHTACSKPPVEPARKKMILTRWLGRLGVAGAAALALAMSHAASGEVAEVRISHGYGVLYLPLMVMASEKLVEKHAAAAGLPSVKASYVVLDGGNVINDAMLSGALDIASSGVPGFLTLWAKAKDNPAQEVRGLTGMSSSSMYLMTRNASVKSLKDFTDKDRIAVPGIKTSLPAVLLHMAAAREFGDANYAKLDPITVGLPHPEALTVLLSGRGEIDSHMASPPFSYIEDATPGLHRVFNSVDLLGNITLDMTYTSRRFFEANPKLCGAFMRR